MEQTRARIISKT